MKITKSKLMNYLKDLTTEEKARVVSGINSIDGSFEGFAVYENDEEFFNIFFENKPQEVARAVYFGNYNFSDPYICINVYGNLDTYDYFEYDEDFKNIYLEEIADWLLENANEWDYLDIDLEEYEED